MGQSRGIATHRITLFRFEIGTFSVVNLDDLLCCLDSPETHLGHLKIVFNKLRQALLKHHQKIPISAR